MELTRIYIISTLIILFAILALIGTLVKISKQAKKDLLIKMYENGDINANIYQKYIDE